MNKTCRFLSIILGIICVICACGITVWGASDLAVDCEVEYSGAANDAEVGEFAVDGYDDTKWCDNSEGMEKWLIVDLGKKLRFDKYIIKNAEEGGEYADYNTRDFEIQISDDKENWTTVDKVEGNTLGLIEKELPSAVEARYVRLYITWPTQRPTAEGDAGVARIYSFELYCENAEQITSTPAQETTEPTEVTTASTTEPTDEPTNAPSSETVNTASASASEDLENEGGNNILPIVLVCAVVIIIVAVVVIIIKNKNKK